MRRCSFFVLLVFCLLPACSVPGSHSGDDSGEKFDLAIRAGELFFPKKEEIRENQVILIEEGTIQDIRSLEGGEDFQAEQTIDHADGTVIPGMVDNHIHLGGTAAPSRNAYLYSPEAQKRRLSSCIRWGVTSVRSLCDHATFLFSLREQSRKASRSMPLIYGAGPAITAPGGHPSQMFSGLPDLLNEAIAPLEQGDDPDRILNRLEDQDADCVKIVYDDLEGPEGGLPKLSASLMKSLVRKALARDMHVVAHAGTSRDVLDLVRAGVHEIHHVPRDITEKDNAQRVIEVLKKNDVLWTPTLSVWWSYLRSTREDIMAELDHPAIRYSIPRATYRHLRKGSTISLKDSRSESEKTRWNRTLNIVKRAHDEGVAIGTGSDAGNKAVYHGYGYIRELLLLREAGLSPEDVLKSATFVTPRKQPGIPVGTVSEGQPATFVLLEGNPLDAFQEIKNIRAIVKKGTVYHPQDLTFRSEYDMDESFSVEQKGAVIDDFEDGNRTSRWGPHWMLATDRVQSGSSTGSLSVRSSKETGYAAFSGSLEGETWNPFVMMTLDLRERGFQHVDASARDGVRVRLKGSAHSLSLGVNHRGNRGYTVPQSTFSVSSDQFRWVEIPFSDLQNPAGETRFRPDEITGVSLMVTGRPGDTFSLRIDRVEFYKK